MINVGKPTDEHEKLICGRRYKCDDSASVRDSENLHVNYAEAVLSCIIVKSVGIYMLLASPYR
jgi:hypothetical protein